MKSDDKMFYRLPPCPLYDVERYESWLGDMAAAGLFLQAQGVLARFRRGTPAPVRYRLTAARLNGSAFDFLPTAPLQEERTLYAESGWQFVCARGEFFIYGCLDPAAPELHTDPAVQALSLKMARRTAWSSFAGVLLNVVVQAVLWSRRTPLLLLVEQPLPVVCLLLFCCCMLGLALRDLYAVLRLTRRLRRGYYHLHLRKLTEDVRSYPDYEVTDLYMHELEKIIRRQPHLWLWSHKRWKHQRKHTATTPSATDGNQQK